MYDPRFNGNDPTNSDQDQYPPVDTTTFSNSVKKFHPLLKQGENLLDGLDDEQTALAIMRAAQAGNHTEVNRIVHSISGEKAPVKTDFTPTGVVFHFGASADKGQRCCSLELSFQWGK